MSGKFVSDLIGAHDISDFITEVVLVSPLSPVLSRGAVVCKKTDGTVTLAGAEATLPAEAYGIVLDNHIDPAVSGGARASIARSGVFDATQLMVDATVQLRNFADQLRVVGIFLEKLPLVP